MPSLISTTSNIIANNTNYTHRNGHTRVHHDVVKKMKLIENNNLNDSFQSSIKFIACLASYGTETVMQLCHGRRRCTISADRTNFGNPCRPESRVYLKVVYTCSKFNIYYMLWPADLFYFVPTQCSTTKSAEGSIRCVR